MILTTELVYEIDQRLNKLSTNTNQSIPLEDKIVSLNNAQIQLIKLKIDRNNIYKSGLDSTKKRIDELSPLIIESKPLTLTIDDNSRKNKYNASTISLDPKYMFYVDSYVLADKNQCIDRILVGNRIGISDLSIYQTNSNQNSSFEYQEILVTTNDNNISVYSDSTFTPKTIYLTYIKYPNTIDLEGYFHLDDSPSINSNSNLPSFLKDELLDLAVKELALATENTPGVEASNIRELTKE